MNEEKKNNPIKILLADDDTDDRFFFDKALKEVETLTHLKTVHDGEQLMGYLSANLENLPDVLFLDLSMPRKTGFECLSEIRENKMFNGIYIVMFSTSYTKDTIYEQGMIKTLYEIGAQDYIRKPNDLDQLKKAIASALDRMKKNSLIKK